jgi:hypothetical protein
VVDESFKTKTSALSIDTDHSGSLLRLTVDRLLVWTAVFGIATSLIGLAAALSGWFYTPQIILISLALTIWCVYKPGTIPTRLPGVAPRPLHVILLVIVALIFRLPAYHYVLGGQDEGVYVNIAHYIEHTGGITVHDRVKQQLERTPFLDNYIEENKINGGDYLPGVYNRGYKNGKLEFQFYHVFPVWMALFGGLFGTTSGVYALTFLAIFSIVLFYRLALLLTGSYRAGLAAGGLLALSPLHAFFSKFPVTEVPALCFALIGFLFLAAFWSLPSAQPSGRGWLVASVLAFLCVFTIRISGFMYLPFFIALAWAALIFDPDRKRCRAFQFWAIGVTGAYLFSVLYGLIWSHAYSHDIYHLSFYPLLGAHWKGGLAALGALVLVTWAAMAMLVPNPKIRARLSRWLAYPKDWIPVVVVWVALLLGLVKIYRLGWTKHYVSDPWLSTVWNLADLGWRSVSASSLWTLFVYLGPFLVVAFLALAAFRKEEPRVAFLFWFVSGFFAYVLLLQWVVPYSPYYARYLLSELAPYTILFVVCVWSGLRVAAVRRLLSVAIGLSLLYATALSAAQIGKNEDDGAYAALARIAAPVGPSDLVLLYLQPNSPFVQSHIKTPLLYTFHRETVTVGTGDLANALYLAKLDSLYNNIFLLTEGGSAPSGFSLVGSTQFDVKSYKRNHSFPHRLTSSKDVVLKLYRMEHVRLPEGTLLGFEAGGAGVKWLESGWNSPEHGGTWSSGDWATLRIDSRDLPETDVALSLRLEARVFTVPSHPTQRIEVRVNGKKVGQYVVRYPQAALAIQVPLGQIDAESKRKIEVAFRLPDAASPRRLGLSVDGRDLAIYLVGASILPSREPVAPALSPSALPANGAPSEGPPSDGGSSVIH